MQTTTHTIDLESPDDVAEKFVARDFNPLLRHAIGEKTRRVVFREAADPKYVLASDPKRSA